MLNNIIRNTPDFLQKPIRSLYFNLSDYIRYGRLFRYTYKDLQEAQFWDKSKVEEYQIEQLKRLLIHSYKTVPYYTTLFNEYKIDVTKIQDFNDFKKIPYLTKHDIQCNIDKLVSTDYDYRKLKYSTTGGSTGFPMGFYVEKKRDKAIEWAFTTHIWSRVGYNVRKVNKCVVLRGHMPKNGLYEYKNKNLFLSSYNLTEQNMKKYIELIEEFNPDFIQAYPSSISIMSDYIIENNIQLSLTNLNAILCASENLYDFQRDKIKTAFKTRAFSFYGHSEHACIGGECEENKYYHLEGKYGYTELINEDGNEANDENEIGEIVATSYINYVMPFIRYKTGDMAINTNKNCICGRSHKLIKKIEGREQEIIIANNGAKISMTSLIFSQHFKAFGKIKNMQIEQNEIGEIIVKIHKNENFNNDDVNELINKIERVSNNTIKVSIKFVDRFDRTNRGKHKFLIQNLNF